MYHVGMKRHGVSLVLLALLTMACPAFAAGNEPALRLRSSRLDGDLVLAPPIPGAGSSGWEVRISGTQVTGDVVNQSGFDPARQIPLFNELRCVGASDAAGVGLTSACGPGPPVATADLRDGAVDTEKLGAGAVTSEEVEDGSLTLADLDLIVLAANFVMDRVKSGPDPREVVARTTQNMDTGGEFYEDQRILVGTRIMSCWHLCPSGAKRSHAA